MTWSTNLPASSYVIYSAEGENHVLNMTDSSGNPPKYGYAHATGEINVDSKTTSHAITITDFKPSTTYYFRMVSRNSLAISGEYKVTTPAEKINLPPNNVPKTNVPKVVAPAPSSITPSTKIDKNEAQTTPKEGKPSTITVPTTPHQTATEQKEAKSNIVLWLFIIAGCLILIFFGIFIFFVMRRRRRKQSKINYRE